MSNAIQAIIEALIKLRILWLGAALFIVSYVIYVLYLHPAPEVSLMDKWRGKKASATACQFANAKLYHFNKTNDNIDFVTVAAENVPVSGDLNTIRLQTITALLNRADSFLVIRGHKPYGKTLMPYFRSLDEVGEMMIHEMADRYLLHMEEDIKPGDNGCLYSISLSLEVNGAGDVSSLDYLIAQQVCLKKTLDTLIFHPLAEHNIVRVTLFQIFQQFCSGCPQVESVRQILKECSTRDCDNIYFKQSAYELSIVSKLILSSLQNRLQKETGKTISVELHGYTDGTEYKSIGPYDRGAYISTMGTLLNDSSLLNNAQKLQEVGNNDQLSFARAFSCYEYMKSLSAENKNINYSYTGWGVNEDYLSDMQKRSVLIIIKNN